MTCSSALEGYATSVSKVQCALPHTGLSVIGIVLAAVVLIALGVSMALIARTGRHDA